MASHNSWTFSGNLGGDPETREAGGSTVCNFSVAVNGRRDSDPTTWVRVAAWGKLGEMCGQYLAKGRQVIVTGAARLREYEGKSGKGVSLEVDAREVTFIGGRDDAQGGGNGERTQRGSGSGWGDAPSKPSGAWGGGGNSGGGSQGGAWGGAPSSDDKVPF